MFKPHPIYNNFLIGTNGTIIGAKGKPLHLRLNKDGYYTVSIYHLGKKLNRLVHRLVCETYHDNPNNYQIVNHIDGNKLNNNEYNLEWCTRKYNTNHAVINNLFDTVLTKENVVYIYTNPDNLIPSQLSKKLNININTIYGVIYDNKWVEVTRYLLKNHVKKSNQHHNQRCLGISPSGERYIFNNKTKFAKEHNLNLTCVIRCLNGKSKKHRDWEFKILNV